jgi:hypothetical protein
MRLGTLPVGFTFNRTKYWSDPDTTWALQIFPVGWSIHGGLVV